VLLCISEQLEFDENDLCWAHTGVLEIFSRVAAAVDPGLLVGDVQSPAEALVNILVAARADLVQKWLSNCVTVWWTKMDSDKRCQEVESRRRCAMVTLIDLMLKTVANEPVARELSMLPDGMLPEEVRERVEQFDQLVHRLKHAAEDKEVKFHSVQEINSELLKSIQELNTDKGKLEDSKLQLQTEKSQLQKDVRDLQEELANVDEQKEDETQMKLKLQQEIDEERRTLARANLKIEAQQKQVELFVREVASLKDNSKKAASRVVSRSRAKLALQEKENEFQAKETQHRQVHCKAQLFVPWRWVVLVSGKRDACSHTNATAGRVLGTMTSYLHQSVNSGSSSMALE